MRRGPQVPCQTQVAALEPEIPRDSKTSRGECGMMGVLTGQGGQVNITPSPRILEMLGQIEFHEWQCLAELLDNSIDELRSWLAAIEEAGQEPNPDDFCIEVILPSSRSDSGSAMVEVRDHGRGMTAERLSKAVKAGWSGNDRFDSLGLFGMGFNVATARLGRVTRVLTTRAGDPEWIGVEIDLHGIDETFEVPDLREPKDEAEDHGTRVIITELEPARLHHLATKQDSLRIRLGHVYGWVLDNTPITIRVNGSLVRPRRLCAWDASRSITYGRGRDQEKIPAVIPIDNKLPDAEACEECGHWQPPGEDKCRRCGSTELVLRERRIHGWVGIQRYLDRTQYGIDFLRNGRKILIQDKSVFSWMDMNDPLANEMVEYPVETPYNGRIVGEIHLDHVPVDYKKDRFETGSKEWKSAITFLRGDSPLRPEIARRLGYTGPNNSPISRLFRGYRRTDPGSRYLIPGDGHTATHQQASEWATRFHRGDADFQDDTKWYEAVLYHDRRVEELNKAEEADSGESDDDAVLRVLAGMPQPPMPVDSPTTETASTVDAMQSQSDKPASLSVHDHVQRLLTSSSAMPSLNREVRADSINDHLTVEAWEINTPPLIEWQRSKKHSPVWAYQADGGRVLVFVDSRHEAFTRQGMSILDLVLAELAYVMLVRKGKQDQMTVPQVVHEIRKLSFPEANVDLMTVQTAARDLLDRIREAVIESASSNPERAWQVLSASEIDQVERQYALRGLGHGQMNSSDTGFINYAPFTYLLRLFHQVPDFFLDDKVFSRPYATLTSETARAEVVRTIGGMLADCVTLASQERTSANPQELKRTKLSLELLEPILRETT